MTKQYVPIFFTEQGKLLTFASLILDRTRNLNNYQNKKVGDLIFGVT